MRVIAGKYRRRRLKSLEGEATRPMLDRVRETLFNVLQTVVPGCVFLDLFAGTGAVGIEALSRGARHVVMVERNPKAAAVIRDNLRELGIQEDVDVFRTDAHKIAATQDADVVFLGPPYAAHEEYHKVLEALSGRTVRYAVAQHDRGWRLPEQYGALRQFRRMDIGKTSLTFFAPEEAEDPG